MRGRALTLVAALLIMLNNNTIDAFAPPLFLSPQSSLSSSMSSTSLLHRRSSRSKLHSVAAVKSAAASSRLWPLTLRRVPAPPPGVLQPLVRQLKQAGKDLSHFMTASKRDSLLLLLSTALVTPLSKKLSLSPILGLLAAGMLLGPNGLSLIASHHNTEILAELGIVFFLFEMGLELSTQRLTQMKSDVFGLGLSQFFVTAAAIFGLGRLATSLPSTSLAVIGGALALSSSAFVLQVLKDSGSLGTRHGKSSFGILLFQDLAVVPLLVVIPLLAKGGAGLGSAISSAMLKASLALATIAFIARVVLNRLFFLVAGAQNREAFLGVTLLTVLSMSYLTEGLGLSNTLGSFLAGVLLSETKYRYQIEADISPFRGVLLGLFFVTVGFGIDVSLITSQPSLIAKLVLSLLLIKTLITTLLSLLFGRTLSTAQHTALLLSQGGEFAFVAFNMAASMGVLPASLSKLLSTVVALSMATTPLAASAASQISQALARKKGLKEYLVGGAADASETAESGDPFVLVAGYGNVGRLVCDLLDRRAVKYIGVERNPARSIEARNRGLPVFFGDVGRPDVAASFHAGKAKAVVVTISDPKETDRAVKVLRREYPNLPIFARAKDAAHKKRLETAHKNVSAMVPIGVEDNMLMMLPFGGAVLKCLGAEEEEVGAILEGMRREVLSKPPHEGDSTAAVVADPAEDNLLSPH